MTLPWVVVGGADEGLAARIHAVMPLLGTYYWTVYSVDSIAVVEVGSGLPLSPVRNAKQYARSVIWGR